MVSDILDFSCCFFIFVVAHIVCGFHVLGPCFYDVVLVAFSSFAIILIVEDDRAALLQLCCCCRGLLCMCGFSRSYLLIFKQNISGSTVINI